MSDRDADPLFRLLAQHHPAPELDEQRLWERIRNARAAAADGDSRTMTWLHPRAAWLAAAAVALVLAASMSRPAVRTTLANEVGVPVRTWTSERVATVRDWLTAEPRTSAEPRVDPPEPPSYVGLIPSDSLSVRIEHCQPEGLLEVRLHSGNVAYLEVTGDRSEELLSRIDTDLVVQNRPDSRASYRLRVPSRVRHLAIRIDTTSITIPIRVRDPSGWILHLQPADAGTYTVGHCRR